MSAILSVARHYVGAAGGSGGTTGGGGGGHGSAIRYIPTAYPTSTGTITTANTTSNVSTSSIVIHGTTIPCTNNIHGNWVSIDQATLASLRDSPITLDDDFVGDVNLPDGVILRLNKGRYELIDKDAKITYKANRIREFNKYLNSSDMVEEFVRYLGALNLTQDEALKIPLETFIVWLIIRAAEHDNEDIPDTETRLLETTVGKFRKPRCKCCGRFISNKKSKLGIEFCSGIHMDTWLGKQGEINEHRS